jgi:Subtilisin inhibitor-like
VVAAVVASVLLVSPAANLTITVWPRGQGHAAHTWTLRCNPPGGTLPRRVAACRSLAAVRGDPFAPTPPTTMCSQIYGGPQEALVRGTYAGRRVRARFDRRDGCAVSRWNRVSFLFPVPL